MDHRHMSAAAVAVANQNGQQVRLAGAVQSHGQPGRLSPQFVEWMMGYPLDWTCLDSAD
jgi:hypothetical protein